MILSRRRRWHSCHWSRVWRSCCCSFSVPRRTLLTLRCCLVTAVIYFLQDPYSGIATYRGLACPHPISAMVGLADLLHRECRSSEASRLRNEHVLYCSILLGKCICQLLTVYVYLASGYLTSRLHVNTLIASTGDFHPLPPALLCPLQMLAALLTLSWSLLALHMMRHATSPRK